MAIYFHDKRNFLYDSITKEYMELRTEGDERSEYHPYPDNADVGTYHFYTRITTKIVTVKNMSLYVLLLWKPRKITAQEKDDILAEWKKKINFTSEIYTGSSAADDIGSDRAREINGY